MPSNENYRSSLRHGRDVQTGRGGGFKRIDGEFDNFYPQEKALWFAFCPNQAWTSEAYNSETGEIEKLEGQFYYLSTKHYIAQTKRHFVCSAGAGRDKPCWGCGIRRHFYDSKRRKEEATGIKEKGEAPISAITEYTFAGVVLENMAKVKAKDKNGNVRKNQKGEPLYNTVPLSLLPKDEAKALKAEGVTSFGKAVHYSVGRSHYNTIIDFDDEMMNHCANCAQHLTCVEMTCPECGTSMEVSDSDGEPLSGQTLKEARGESFKCGCGYRGPFLPVVACECGDPVEGKLTDFALRLVSRKTSDTSRVLEYTEVRPLAYFLEKHPDIAEKLEKPLRVDEIKAPWSIPRQEALIPDSLRGDGVTPQARTKKKNGEEERAAVPYPLASGSKGRATRHVQDDDDDDDD